MKTEKCYRWIRKLNLGFRTRSLNLEFLLDQLTAKTIKVARAVCVKK